MHLVIPKSFNDAQDVADKFKDSIPVIINLQGSETDLSKRLIDFASGLTYALDGGMQRIADKVFLLTPRNVELSERGARAADREGLLQPVRYDSHRPMQSALVGHRGNMARALALGWGEPVLCTDSGSGRAQRARRARRRRGGRLQPRAGRARRPRRARPQARAARRGGRGDRRRRQGRRLDPRPHDAGRACARPTRTRRSSAIEPNTPVEVRRGVLAFAVPDAPVDDDLHAARARAVRAARHRRGRARAADARRRRDRRRRARVLGAARRGAGRRRGPPRACRRSSPRRSWPRRWPARPSCCARASYDTLALRRAVASPGGTTARGLAALERGGVRAALAQAMDDVVDFA